MNKSSTITKYYVLRQTLYTPKISPNHELVTDGNLTIASRIQATTR